MTPLSDQDKALLRWSGELDGKAPPEEQGELDALATALGELPEVPAPGTALAAALERRNSDPANRRIFGMQLPAALTAAAAIAILATGLFLAFGPLSSGSHTSTVTVAVVAPAPTPARRTPLATPLKATPSENLKRIREARARISRARSFREPLFSRQKSGSASTKPGDSTTNHSPLSADAA